MSFRPFSCPERWRSLGAVLGLAIFDLLLLRIIISRPVDGISYLMALFVLGSLPVGVYIAYRTLGVFTLEYWVDRDAVTFIWALTRHVVPVGDIQRIQLGAAPSGRAGVAWGQLRHWPGKYCRQEHGHGVGRIHCYATRPLEEQVILVTGGDSYGLSPADAEGFLAALQERYSLGMARMRKVEVQHPPLWRWPLWRDATALLLIGAGLVGLLVMFGVLSVRFPGLSSDLPLHFDANGLPDRIAPKAGLFALPVIGLLAWLANLAGGVWIYRRVQRQGAYLLWAGAVAVEIIAGLALFNLMRW